MGFGAGLSPEQTARLREGLRQLAEGIAALHRYGLVHRDVKPQNVRVSAAGRVVLLDFGLAAGLDDSGLHANTDEAVVGTLAYMAPEQLQGGRATVQSDLYSFGLIAYEIMTGALPFGSASPLRFSRSRVRPSEVGGDAGSHFSLFDGGAAAGVGDPD